MDLRLHSSYICPDPLSDIFESLTIEPNSDSLHTSKNDDEI